MPSPYNLLISAVGHPLLVLAGWAVLVALAWRWTGGSPGVAVARRVIVAASLAALASCAAIVTAYLIYPAYFDRVEPAVTSVSWIFFARGFPLYPAPDDPHRYAHVYGPMLFFIQGLMMRVLGPGIVVSKVAGVAASVASLVVVFAAIRRHARGIVAVGLTAVAAAAFLCFQNVAFWNRPDPFIVLLTAVAATLAPSRRFRDLVVIGCAATICVNLKITAALYFTPFLPLVFARHAIPPLLAASAVSLGALVLPFAHPQVSVVNYLYWLRYCTGGAIVPDTLVSNLEWGGLVLLPVAAAYASYRGPLPAGERLTLSALVASVVAVALLAAIPGAGSYHLLPFVPVSLIVAVRPWPATPAPAMPRLAMIACTAGALTVVSIAAVQQYRFLDALDWGRARTLRTELEAIRAELKGRTAALSYSGDQPLAAMFRPLFVFDRDPYLVDGPALMDHQMGGIEIPPSTADLLASCVADTLVFANDVPPLRTRNIYPSTGFRNVFAGPFAEAFAAHYHRESTRGHFDLWRCKR
jgi:hypothetical protein